MNADNSLGWFDEFGKSVCSVTSTTWGQWKVTGWMMKYYVNFFSKPITGAARSKAWNVFTFSNTGIVGLNATRGMGVCPRFLCVCVVLCRERPCDRAGSPVQGVLPTVYKIHSSRLILMGNRPEGSIRKCRREGLTCLATRVVNLC
jgi:hypothetical protein